jgi:uncharacterized membrane protein
MNRTLKRDVFPLIIVLLFGLVALYAYRNLPEMIPSHFNSEGIPDGFAHKSVIIFLNVGILVFIYVILTFLPFIDPFWRRIEKKYSLFLLFRDLILVFFLFFFIVIVFSAQEGRFQKDAFGVGFGLLFILLGNYLPRLPRNFFFGIRSPWTLASETVWKKTHLLSGWLFVLAGVIVAILSLLKIKLEIVLVAILLPVVLFCGLVYPLYLYKKLQKGERNTLPQL